MARRTNCPRLLQYYGEPIKLVISKIKENDEVVLECIKKLITMLGGIEAEEDL